MQTVPRFTASRVGMWRHPAWLKRLAFRFYHTHAHVVKYYGYCVGRIRIDSSHVLNETCLRLQVNHFVPLDPTSLKDTSKRDDRRPLPEIGW